MARGRFEVVGLNGQGSTRQNLRHRERLLYDRISDKASTPVRIKSVDCDTFDPEKLPHGSDCGLKNGLNVEGVADLLNGLGEKLLTIDRSFEHGGFGQLSGLKLDLLKVIVLR